MHVLQEFRNLKFKIRSNVNDLVHWRRQIDGNKSGLVEMPQNMAIDLLMLCLHDVFTFEHSTQKGYNGHGHDLQHSSNYQRQINHMGNSTR